MFNPTEKEPGATFGHLPYEMVEAIFDNLDHVERQKIRSVSCSWNRAVSQLFVVELHVENSNFAIIQKTEARFMRAIFRGLSEKLILEQSLEQFNIFCSRLQKLKITGNTLPENFFLILQKLERLKKLTLDEVRPSTEFLTCNHGNGTGLNNVVSLTYKFYPGDLTTDICYTRQIKLFQVVAESMRNGKLHKLKIVMPSSSCPCPHNFYLDILQLNLIQGSPEVEEQHHTTCKCQYRKFLGTIITGSKRTLQTLQLGSSKVGHRLEFLPNPRAEDNAKLRLEVFHGGADYFLARSTPFLQMLLGQDGLKELNLYFTDIGDGDSQELAQIFENTTSEIISKNFRSLTIVGLTYWMVSDPKNHNCSFTAAFPLCTNLQVLSLTHKHVFHHRGDPTFTGMEMLPRSLLYFNTNFAIGTEAVGMQDVDLSNLVNLQILRLFASPLFVFGEALQPEMTVDDDDALHPDSMMTVDDFNALKSKLPGVQNMVLKVGNYDKQNTEKVMVPTVTPELITTFENCIVETNGGQFLDIEF